VTSKQENPRRLPPEERRQQIVEAVLRVVAEHGVSGASTARLSRAARVSQGTLYQYFASRQEMFAAALDEIFTQMEALFFDVTEPHPIDRIREEVRRHAELMKTGRSFVCAWMEFVAAGTHEGLRPEVAKVQVRVFAMLKELVEQGKADGAIRPEIDSDRLVWQWQTVLWGENMSCLMGLPAFMDEGHSAALLDLILDAADTRLPGGRPMPATR
jgi:AcrR family transcriptional regulator